MELLISTFLGIVVYEAYAWLPSLSQWLLDRAVRQLPEDDQERCREEWKANLDALPNSILRVIHALSLGVAARAIDAETVEEALAAFDELLIDVTRMRSNVREKVISSVVLFENHTIAAIDGVESLENKFDELRVLIASSREKIDSHQISAADKASLRARIDVLASSLPSTIDSWMQDRAPVLARIQKAAGDILRVASTLKVVNGIIEKHFFAIEQLRSRKVTLVELEGIIDEFIRDFEQVDACGDPGKQYRDKQLNLGLDPQAPVPDLQAVLAMLRAAKKDIVVNSPTRRAG